MRKSIFILFFALLGVFSARAYNFEVDGIYYNIISGTDQVEVTSSGRSDTKYTGSVVIPATVEYNETSYSVTSIGYKAFEECKSLTSVTIPNSVTSIGAWAFNDCTSLVVVTMGEGVTSIGENAFDECKNLTSVTIPESVTSVGNNAFYGCTSIDNPLYNSRIFILLPSGYSGGYTIPYGIQSIAPHAFNNCKNLTSVTIPETVTSIGQEAFRYCEGLTSVTIPKGVTAIGSDAFANCKGLTTVTLSEGVTTIGSEAFYACSGLTSVTIPKSVTAIGSYAFAYTGLTSVTSLAQTPPVMGYHASWGYYGAFSDYSATIYVPKGCKAAYQAAEDWSSFSKIEELATVTLSVNNSDWGTVAGGGDDYKPGRQIAIEATPTVGYYFVKWDDENTDNPRSLTVTGDVTLTAVFAPLIEVTLSATEGGTVTGGGDYELNEQVTIEATPNEGYYFVKWDDENTDNPRALTVTENTTLTAVFAPFIEVTLSATEGGTVTGGGQYKRDEQVTLTATPNEGYRFVNWTKADGVEFSTEEVYSFTVNEDLTLVANFEEIPPVVVVKTYTVSVSANNAAWGSVSQSGTGTYDSAVSVIITATPNEGYRFVNWTKADGLEFSTDSLHTFTVNEDLTLVANFEEIPPVVVVKTYTVSVSANNAAWGSVAQSGNGIYDSASSVTITATPNEGYRFINWTKDNEVFSTDSMYTFTVNEDLTLVANFEEIPPVVVVKTYTVSVSANNAAWGSVSQSGNGIYDSATSVIITATPNEGYRFVNWTKEDGSEFSTDSLYTFIIMENLELLANFEKMPDTPIDPDTPTANEKSEADNLHIYVQDRTIYLSEDRGTVQVYNMAGQRIYNGHATAIPVRQSGVYIVAVGQQRIKVPVR